MKPLTELTDAELAEERRLADIRLKRIDQLESDQLEASDELRSAWAEREQALARLADANTMIGSLGSQLAKAQAELAADAPAAPDSGELVEPDPTRTCPTCGTSWTADIDACPQCQDAHPAACCDLHNRNCEPPSELCCNNCTEAKHYTFPYPHADGSKCVLDTAGSEATDG